MSPVSQRLAACFYELLGLRTPMEPLPDNCSNKSETREETDWCCCFCNRDVRAVHIKAGDPLLPLLRFPPSGLSASEAYFCPSCCAYSPRFVEEKDGA